MFEVNIAVNYYEEKEQKSISTVNLKKNCQLLKLITHSFFYVH